MWRDPQAPCLHSPHARSKKPANDQRSHQSRCSYRPCSHSYLDLALAIIHHTVLGGHSVVAVQRGGIEGDLLHFGNLADGVSLTGTCGLIFVFPVREELLKQSRLTSTR